MPRSSALARAIASAVCATSTPRTVSPSEATCKAFSPVPQPTSSTAPANPPSAASRTTAGCGRPRSQGAGPSWYDASQGSPVSRSWLVGRRPLNGPSARSDRSDKLVSCLNLTGRAHWLTKATHVSALPWRLDRSRVVVLPDVAHCPFGCDAVEDRQADKSCPGPAPAAAAGHLDAFGRGPPPQLEQRVPGIRAVDGQPPVRPAHPPGLPGDRRRRHALQVQAELGGEPFGGRMTQAPPAYRATGR